MDASEVEFFETHPILDIQTTFALQKHLMESQ